MMLSIRLKEFRERCGMTQKQIACILQMDRSTYAYYETGKTSPDILTLFKLAQIFKISVDELIGESRVAGRPLMLRSASPQYNVFTDNEKMYNLNDEEQMLVMYYRLMNEEIRARMLSYIAIWMEEMDMKDRMK